MLSDSAAPAKSTCSNESEPSDTTVVLAAETVLTKSFNRSPLKARRFCPWKSQFTLMSSLKSIIGIIQNYFKALKSVLP